MSPYLFLLVVEALSWLISNAARRELFHGAKAATGGSEVCHLFFANGSLLFYMATRQ